MPIMAAFGPVFGDQLERKRPEANTVFSHMISHWYCEGH